MIDTIVSTVDVSIPPAVAFDVFAQEFGSWYRNGPYSWVDSSRAKGIRLEPGVGGRIVEIWDDATGEGYAWGTITIWEPDVRFVFTYRNVNMPPSPLTTVEVRFEPKGTGTCVTLEHSGWSKLPTEFASATPGDSRFGWDVLLRWYRDHVSKEAE